MQGIARETDRLGGIYRIAGKSERIGGILDSSEEITQFLVYSILLDLGKRMIILLIL